MRGMKETKRMKRGMIRGLIVVMLMLISSAGIFADEQKIVLIAHSTVQDTLTSEEVKQIFLGRKTRWSDDIKITFILLTHEPVYEPFLKEYIRKTPFQYKNFWKKQVFTGKGRMPKALKQVEDVLEFVSGTEGAISFALLQDVAGNDAVKIIPLEE